MKIAQIAPLAEKLPSASLRRHRKDRFLSDRRAGGAGPRGDALRQRRFEDQRGTGALFEASASVKS